MKQIIFLTILALFFSFSAFAQTQSSPCPKIAVNGGGVVRPGELAYFTAHVGDDTDSSKFKYEWTITAGTIIEGLGSPTIKVDTTGLQNINLTATVEIKGLPENCVNTSSETLISEDHCRLPILADEFGKLPNGEVKARINAIYVQLGNEQNSQGYLINYGTDKEIAAREKQIRKAIDFLKYDSSRLTIVRGGKNPNGAGVWTKVWIVQPGADNPQP